MDDSPSALVMPQGEKKVFPTADTRKEKVQDSLHTNLHLHLRKNRLESFSTLSNGIFLR